MSNLKPHNHSSFSYKITDKRIQNILAQRSKVTNTVQVGMPFVKATTTIGIEEYLGPGNVGFTLGIHSLPDSGYQSLFETTGNPEDPMVGYTYTRNGSNIPIYSTAPSVDTALGRYFTPTATIQNIANTKGKIPPPGITGLKVGRNRNGLLAMAELSISVPTLQQLEYLHRVFLIPGCGMVVEWGQQFAPSESTPLLVREQMFPWYNRAALEATLDRLAKDKYGMEAILLNSVYPTRGQYMWMFGRIANFAIKGTSDGSFDVTVKIVGPSEDQWAYSVRQTVLSPSNPDTKPCVDGANSVESYLTNTTANGHNLKTLLDDVLSETKLSEWAKHVIQIENGNKKEGAEGNNSAPNTNQSSFADADNAYFMTWRFFVNVVLNDENFGIKSIYKKANLPNEVLANIRFIRPYSGSGTPIDDKYENYVGNNPYLRSFDPGTMIIVNEHAAIDAEIDYGVGPESAKELLDDIASNEITQKFLDAGSGGKFDFLKSDPQYANNPLQVDRGLLSTGVWLNHKAVISSLLSANTILQGISNLLNKMNYATKNYWNLTLDISEPVDGDTSVNYTVVDANYKGSSDQAVKELIEEDKIYTFNKFLRQTPNGIVGSELIDFNVDLDLPKLLFSQIATMGLSDSDNYQDASSQATTMQQCKNATVSDPNDSLRRMFGITTVSAKPGFQSVDLTRISTPKQLGACQNSAAATSPAGAGGRGLQAAPPSPNDSDSTEDLKEQQQEAQEFLDDPDNFCKECEPCFTSSLYAEETFPPAPVSNVGATHPSMKGSTAPYANAQVPLSALSPITGQGSYSVAQSNNPGARARYQNKQWLEKEAAVQFQKLIAHANRDGSGCPAFTISSAYRDLQHQRDLSAASTGNGVATPGNSPHGMGRAIDFAELFAAVGGSTNGAANANVRQNNTLYRWLANNAPAFGWYNPKRLADGSGVDECWHWEYWGYEYPPTNTPPIAPSTQATPRPSGSCSPDLLIKVGTRGFDRAFTQDSKIQNGRIRCAEAEIKCKRSVAQIKQLSVKVQESEQFDNAIATALRDFPNLNKILRYVEIIPEHMINKIRCSANGIKANAFGASPATLSIKAELTLPGIAGLRVGELFWIDKIPAVYKIFGAFQIMSIEEVIGVDGWQTKISAVFNFLGNSWKNSMLRLTQPIREAEERLNQEGDGYDG